MCERVVRAPRRKSREHLPRGARERDNNGWRSLLANVENGMRIRSSPLAASILIALGALVIAPSIASAGDPDPVAHAREEFRRGLSLEAAGKYEEALEVYKAVALVKSTPQVRYHIAFCQETIGDWVDAVGSYRLALADANDAKVKDVAKESEAAIAKLEPKIPTLTITRGDGAEAAKVVLDGTELGPASIGTAIQMNRGSHTVEASAPGHEPSRQEVKLDEGSKESVSLTLKVIPDAPVQAGGSPIQGGDEPVKKGPSALIPIGATAVALGVASLAVSGAFFGLRQSAINKLNAACGPDKQQCPADLQATATHGKLYASVSTATFAAGAAAVGLGGVLLIVEASKPKAKKHTQAAWVSVDVGLTGGTVFGEF